MKSCAHYVHKKKKVLSKHFIIFWPTWVMSRDDIPPYRLFEFEFCLRILGLWQKCKTEANSKHLFPSSELYFVLVFFLLIPFQVVYGENFFIFIQQQINMIREILFNIFEKLSLLEDRNISVLKIFNNNDCLLGSDLTVKRKHIEIRKHSRTIFTRQTWICKFDEKKQKKKIRVSIFFKKKRAVLFISVASARWQVENRFKIIKKFHYL